MTRQHIGSDATVPAFTRNGLEALKGIDTRTARTLESLPQSRDTIIESINGLVDDTNAIEAEPILLFNDPTDPILSNVRKLTGGDNVSATVGASEVVLDLTDTGVTPDTYGAPTKLVVLAIDAKGRVTSASEVVLNSDNVTEGAVHLFFTDARARAAISGSGQIGYNSTSGVISSSGFTGTQTPVTSITVSNGIVTAVS